LAARTIREDVSGIDLNCGCPKWFSVHAGMGAALLSTPEKLCSILRTLVEGIPDKPISCKIRLLPDKERTIELVRMIKETGIKALAVHCRTPRERPDDPANWGYLELIAEAIHPLPLIVNGDVFSTVEINKLFSISGVKSVMIARAAQWNASIFLRQDSPLDIWTVSKKYVEYCLEAGNNLSNSKYTLLQMWTYIHNKDPLKKKIIKELQESKTINNLCVLFRVNHNKEEEDNGNNDNPLELDGELN
jgi:tRNA-dihydrouridine synthase 2